MQRSRDERSSNQLKFNLARGNGSRAYPSLQVGVELRKTEKGRKNSNRKHESNPSIDKCRASDGPQHLLPVIALATFVFILSFLSFCYPASPGLCFVRVPLSSCTLPTPFVVKCSCPERGHYALSLLLMSTSIDSRRRPNLWSYISFGSAPRRRSVSLPTKSNDDPFEKSGRHSRVHSYGSSGAIDHLRNAWMAQNTRSRYLRGVGLAAFLVFVFFLLAPGERAKVGNFVGSICSLHVPREFR